LVADIAPDRIVFHLQKKVGETKLKEFGLVSPSPVCVFSVSDTEETVSCSSSVSHASGETGYFAYVCDFYLATDPLQDIGPPSAQPPDTNWRDFEPESGSNFAKAEEDDAADDAAN